MKIIPFKIPKTEKDSFLLQEDHVSHFYDKLHQHSEVQLTLMLKSEGTLIAGDFIGSFYVDDLYLIGSNLPHVFKNEDRFYQNGKTEAHMISVFFDKESFGKDFLLLPETAGIRSFIYGLTNCYKITGETAERIKQKMLQLFKLEGFDRMLHLLSIINLMATSTEIVKLSNFKASKSYDASEGKRMNDILTFSIKQFHRKITIEEIAQVANMTPEAFCRYFKVCTRKTYLNFLNEIRITNACKLLINKDLTIAEISANSGFNNLSNFNRIFKKVTGLTPSLYLLKSQLQKARKE
ncbi:AraC family transcriptional regulator [Solitalea sp. MAHUQ-68]|uniref:AraC family transcriptional regulator n=1 Tax=Solitalea agri TaxID=2953739 RepID=A0A9X2JBY7_9SPHI|nr:AraC family transcriptional regulator [Solitalea agri]MCO4291954.1 AraC family transcriptional regulator [Solitalea agri]